MNWIQIFQKMLFGNVDERLRQLEDREIEISEEQRKQRGKFRQVLLSLRRDKCVKWIHATSAIGTVLIGMATMIIGVKGCQRATQEIELTREKAFYHPGISIQETNGLMAFTFMDPGERTFQDFRAVWGVAHIPSSDEINRGMSLLTKQVWGVINGRESLSVAIPIPPTNDNLYAMAVCSGISIFNGESRTNRAVAVRYRYGGQWFDYRGGATTLGTKDRKTVEKELQRMHEINRSQSSEKYSDNWQ